MSTSHISYHADDGVAVITFNRPEKRNAFTREMCSDLRGAFLRFQEGPERVAVLAAEGSTFTAGADLNDPPDNFWRMVPGLGVQVDKPLIAAVSGPVIGMGVALLAFCDLCVAAEDTKIIYPEAKVGVAMGLIASMTCRIPYKMAMQLMLLGEPIDARRAYETGMVNWLTPPGEHVQTAKDVARRMAGNAPLVMSMLKNMAAQTLPKSPVEESYLAQARVSAVVNSQDAQEGLNAFREKRAPQYKGT